MTWQPPPPEHQNGIITSYVVSVFLEDNDTIVQQYTTSSLSVTLVRLHPFSMYMVAVAAETGVGSGPFSSGFTIRTPEDSKAYIVMSCVIAHVLVASDYSSVPY